MDMAMMFNIVLQGDPEHPICPVMLQDARLANLFADEMLGMLNHFCLPSDK